MAAFAPPVHRDRFFYSFILHADAGNDNHHPRASVAELTALLRPEAPNGKKARTQDVVRPIKDHPWHYWTAQLIHYGLTSTKDKNAAKVRLLGALNANKLEVPDWIQKLEAEVKKEWEAENRKLKKATKEGGASKQAKTKEPAANAKNSSVKEGTKKEPVKKALAKEVPRSSSKTPSATNATPKSAAAKRKRDETEQSDTTNPNKKTKSKGKTEIKIASPGQTAILIQSPASRKPLSSDEEPWPAPQRRIINHDAWRFFDFDHLVHTRPSNAPHPCPYRVSCPDAEAEWDQDSIKEFYLAFSATEEEWWSRFEWGAFKGILILQRQPKRVNKAVGVPFKWRAHYAYGHEDGDGEGKIFFDSLYTIKGEIYNFFREKPCHFRGQAIQYAQAPGHPYQTPAGTPVLDQLRIEWSQMPTIMRDTPAKKARVKKEKPSEHISGTVDGHSGVAATDLGQDDIYLSGTYRISSNSIEEAFLIPTTNRPLRLTLFTEETSGLWWASFQWAMFDGIMKLDPGPTYETIDQMHTFGWRIRNTETGALAFGRNCTGEISFDGKNRTLVGALYDVPGIGGIDFEGKRMAGPRRVGGLKKEWDWFVEEAYGR